MRSDKPEKRSLLISYHFPPSAAVGGQRMVNFARCLSSLGWEPHVLTIQDRNIEQMDAGRLRRVEGISIHKVAVLPTVAGIWIAAKQRVRRPLGKHSHSDETRPNGATDGNAPNGESFARKMRRYVLSFLVLPDFERGWILPATLEALRQIRRHRIGWIVTSCPPYSVHLVGLAVKALTGTKWAADFRDPWMTTGSKRLYPTSALSLRTESWLERRVVESADLVVFNVERLRNAYRDRYTHLPKEKFVFLPNGVVAPESSDLASVAKYETFTLSYTGSLYVGRSPEPVFQAVSRLIQNGDVDPEAVRIKLVGQCRNINGIPTSSLIRKYCLTSVVEVQDSVPHTEALDIVRRSHLAILLAPGLPFQIPAKLYDYLGVGTRILAIAEEGGTADVVTQTGCGRAFSPVDVDGMMSFIHAEMNARGSSNGGHAVSLARFDLQSITEELVGHFDRIAATSSAEIAR